MRPLQLISLLLVFSLGCFPSHRRHKSRSVETGAFDFYILVLAWAPEFCYSHPDASECSTHSGFVVHGLWPQNSDGSYPSNCATNHPPPSDFSSLADIMPQEIIRHEWQTHGTCSGLSGDAYFALIRRAFESVTIPADLKAPSSSSTMHPRELKQDFEKVNASLNDSEIAVQLRGRYLNAVEICLSKTEALKPAACSNVRDASGGSFIVPPVR